MDARSVSPCRLVIADSGAIRLDAAAAFLSSLPPGAPATIVAATRGAADDLARRHARERPATFGLSRYSLTQLAARLAAPRLAGRGIVPATPAGLEAAAARVVADAASRRTLAHLAPVAATPGFPRALARSVTDLRLGGISPAAVGTAGAAGDDLAALLTETGAALSAIGAADRARLLEAAIEGLADDPVVRVPLLLLDLPVESDAEARLLQALIASAPRVMATIPRHDAAARALLLEAGAHEEAREEPCTTDLQYLRRFLFADDAPPVRPLDGSLEFFSAPGEGRECVEMARRVLAEAGRGIRFDEMAVFVRSPDRYQGLLEDALARAGIPAWFDRGLRRPHPAGRAFLALLACADDSLSASRFAEYLSLGQLPLPEAAGDAWTASADELFGPVAESAVSVHADARLVDGRVAAASGDGADDVDAVDDVVDADEEGAADGADGADIAGSLAPARIRRAPRRWERLLVEAAVIGGGAERWERRLDGLAAELEARAAVARRQDPASARTDAIQRDLVSLRQLRAYALPIVRDLSAWPREEIWDGWLDRLTALAPRTLRDAAGVLRALADLRPMGPVGPVALADVRRVLDERLRMLDTDPPARRFGRLFVGAPALARGRTFRVVFIPGLAERMFPRKPQQDPLLPDAARRELAAGLATRADQGRRDRLLLHLAAGAASERLHVSYPRIDVSDGRPRVPSFYALDILRAATGRMPDHDRLTEAAAAAGDRTLAWPAPADPSQAIDEQEHDLSVLRQLLDAPDAAVVRGRAQYMLRANGALRRSVTERWARAERRWSPFEGLTRVTDQTREALEAQRPTRRPYAASALQRFAVCPYQFLLGAMHRLAPMPSSQPLQRLDPLTRGRLVHAVQSRLYQALRTEEALPVTRESLDAGLDTLDRVLQETAGEYRERLLPTVDRVWREEVAGIGRDLRGWLRQAAEDGDSWLPLAFELAFGLPPAADRDAASRAEPALIDGRFLLRGVVDLVEQQRGTGLLRIIDYKTGADRTKEGLAIGGGVVLQPLLYAIAIETMTGNRVEASQLFFCTAASGYARRTVPITERSRRAAIEALEVVDRAIERGLLPVAPAEGACRRCDYRPVCGPGEEQRVRRKPADYHIQDLLELRRRP